METVHTRKKANKSNESPRQKTESTHTETQNGIRIQRYESTEPRTPNAFVHNTRTHACTRRHEGPAKEMNRKQEQHAYESDTLASRAIRRSIHLTNTPSIRHPIHPSIHPSTHSFIHPPTSLLIYPLIHPSTRPSTPPSTHPSLHSLQSLSTAVYTYIHTYIPGTYMTRLNAHVCVSVLADRQ